MLFVPIVPLVWVVSWLIRLIVKRYRSSSPAAPGSRTRRGGVLRTPLTVFHYVYITVAATLVLAVGLMVGALFEDALLGVVAIAVSFDLIFRLPHWLAWRVLGPRGWLRAARGALWVAFHWSREDRKGELQLLAAAYDRCWQPGKGRVTPWTVFALALQVDEEDPRVADLILAGVHRHGRLPQARLRSQGAELVAWPAVRRRDWRRVVRRVAQARGRGVRLLRLLAQAHLDAPPRSPLLWLAWALAPGRRATLPYVREALAARKKGRAGASPPETGGSVWMRHLRLLSQAAGGRPVRTAELEALAGDWTQVLEGAGHTRILARGLELGVQDVARTARGVWEAVEKELEALAAVAEGAWSQTVEGGLAASLRSRQVEALILLLERETEGFPASGGVARPLDPPLVELGRWYRFQRNVERLRAAGGPDPLITLWYNGLRYVACNWPVFLGKAYPTDAFWACREMHVWCANLSADLKDQEIHQLSHNNSLRY